MKIPHLISPINDENVTKVQVQPQQCEWICWSQTLLRIIEAGPNDEKP